MMYSPGLQGRTGLHSLFPFPVKRSKKEDVFMKMSSWGERDKPGDRVHPLCQPSTEAVGNALSAVGISDLSLLNFS